MKAVLLTEEEVVALRLPAERPGPRIVVALEGGVVQGWSANAEGLCLTIVDYDESFDAVSQPDGGTATAGVYAPRGRVDPAWVDGPILLEDSE